MLIPNASASSPFEIVGLDNICWIMTILFADIIYALKDGRVEQSGDPDEVYKKGGIYKDIIDASACSLNIEKIARTIDCDDDD